MKDYTYSGKLRVRVAGLLVKNKKLLLAKLSSPISKEDIWTPPGGGVEYGESIHEALIREFKEETGLLIKVNELLHINELIEPPFHAIEFYFLVDDIGGELKLGIDPEHDLKSQLLKDLKYLNITELSIKRVVPIFLNERNWLQKKLTAKFKGAKP